MKDQTVSCECMLPGDSEWTLPLIERYHAEIDRVAREYGLDTYPTQIEIITAEQMMDAYASVGMPVNYHHWSFGKQFLATEQRYRRGHMGLAYEIVINSDPCIAYLMEENTLPMQALVIAHAAYGHNSFFKGNYLFRMWTQADAIIDYLVFARNFIADCEMRYGEEEVESILDSCHSLMNLGVDRYKHPPKLSVAEEKHRLKDRQEYLQSQVNELWRTIPGYGIHDEELEEEKRFPSEPQENLLYFIEKHSPVLEPWQREVVRIVRKIAQYFFPQRQTQVMNEGWATYWHYTIMNTLFDQGVIPENVILEFLHSHTNVVYQPDYNSKWYSGINPYALGFAMWKDIRRICEDPTDEDRQWFPEIAGSNWRETFDFAMRNFKDESFIAQYLSPKVMRDFHLFAVHDDEQERNLLVTAIHDDRGYHALRAQLSELYNLGAREPDIQVVNVDVRGDRTLTLRHTQWHNRPLGETSPRVIKDVAKLWGFTVRMESKDAEGKVKTIHEERLEKRKSKK